MNYDVLYRVVEYLQPNPVERRWLERPLSKQDAHNPLANLQDVAKHNAFVAQYAPAADQAARPHISLAAAFDRRMASKPRAHAQAIRDAYTGKGGNLPPDLLPALLNDFDFIRAAIVDQPAILALAALEIQQEPALLMHLLQHSRATLDDLHPLAMRHNLAFFLQAAPLDGEVLFYASKELRARPELYRPGVASNPAALAYLDPALDDFRPMALEQLKKNGLVLLVLPRTDKEFVLAGVAQNGLALALAAERYQDSNEVVGLACAQNPWAIEHASARLRNFKPLVQPLVEREPEVLQHAGPAVWADRDWLLRAIAKNPALLLAGGPRLLTDKDMVIQALAYLEAGSGTSASDILALTHESLRADREVVFAAILHDGTALEHASDLLKNDFELARTAVIQTGDAFAYLSPALRGDHELAWLAIQSSPGAYAYLGEGLRANKALALEALRLHGPALWPFLSVELRFALESADLPKALIRG